MHLIRLSALLLSLQCLVPIYAQTCNCTVAEVESNTVAPCSRTIGTVVSVSTTSALQNAINQMNSVGGNMTILIADGTYPIASPNWYPYITASNVVIRSQSGNRNAVILTGTGMSSVSPNTEIAISFQGSNSTIADLTIRNVGNHGISVQGDSLYVHNVRIQDTYEQMIKGTSGGNGSRDGIVQCSLFEYTDGVGPQYYIGGLDIHEGQNWIVRDNVFKDIASPPSGGSLAEHAIHFWDNSLNNTVERNRIVNCDRGIGFGLGSSMNTGGIIRNNMIYNDGQDPYHDVGIGLESSPNTKVYNNTIHIAYQYAIEYRFAATTNADIVNNLCNQAIQSRNGGQATLNSNITNAQASWYVGPSAGDLHLTSNNVMVVDQGTDLPVDVPDDIDKTMRPQGVGHDIGAHEYSLSVGLDPELAENKLTVFPNPVCDQFTIVGVCNTLAVDVFDSQGHRITLSMVNVNPGKANFNVGSLPNGVYLIRYVDRHDGVRMARFLIAR